MTRHQNIAVGVALVLLGVLVGAVGISSSYAITGGAAPATLTFATRFTSSAMSLGGFLVAVVLTVLAVRFFLKGFRE